jgi:signal transduction histidine kinase
MSFALLPRIIRTAGFGLAIVYALLFATSGLIVGIVVYWTVAASLERQMAARIDAEVELLQQEYRSEGLQELVDEVSERTTYFHALEYLVLDADSRRLVGNLPEIPVGVGWSDVSIPPDAKVNSGRQFRVRSVVLADGVRLAVGDELGPIEDIQSAFLEALGWALLAFLILSVSGGLLISRQFLQRVDAFTRTAEAVIGGELGSRVPLRGTRDNFDRLAHTLNRMLDRIQELMESLSQVSNDIAHALRTPLSRLRQKLERARASVGANSESERAIDAAAAETETILDTFSALLRIAQIEAGTRTAGFRQFDLSEIFQTVTEAYATAAEDQGKAIIAQITPSIRSWGDKDLLTEMLANLLDNAITHTPAGAQIEVSLVNGGSLAVGSVADDGPGIPLADRGRIFRRFYRLERSMRTPGSGLGLSMVAAVADLHGVRLSVDDNRPGLRMTMTFPASNSQLGWKGAANKTGE